MGGAGLINARTIKEIDDETYAALQLLVAAESRANNIHPVEYDDVMWRKLNRERADE